VDLFSQGAGLDGRNVGTIELTPGTSYVQVPDTFAKGLSGGGNTITHQGSRVTIRKVASPTFASTDRPKSHFEKKKSFRDKRR
jgi:hypothetical protein